ncbi:MAG TPA: HD domain-containing phosphohydrolase [Myxococcales bacterium]|nr:HD domain-containing phosphohydrolase [Myxococcales bacterium]
MPDPTDPLLIHDRSLTTKVARGSEAGDIVEQQLILLGTQLVSQLNVLLRTTRSHGGSNAALERPVASIRTLVKALGNDQPVVLRVQEGFVFLGERHLKTSVFQIPIFSSFIDAIAALGIGAVSIKPDVDQAHLRKFAELFVGMQPSERLEALVAKLKDAGIHSVELEAPRAIAKQDAAEGAIVRGDTRTSAQGGDRGQLRQRARSAYSRVGTALAELNHNARGGGTIHFRQAKRAIQNIADLLLKDPATVLGLTTLRSHDEYTQNHSVNVALLSMALANRVGYSKVELGELGLAALFHDLGKCAVPLEVLNKPDEFTAAEWDVMRTHPSEGVLALLASRGLPRVPARMAAASFEHHLTVDGTGYPALRRPWKQTLSSRVIAVADCYDAMTSARVYRREPFAPPNALRYMIGKSGTLFEPVLLKYFVTCIGIIPIGTLVLLDTGELATVLRPAPDKEHLDRPPVRIIAGAQGNALEPAPEHDLRELTANGAYARSIVRLVDNTEYHLETARWVSAAALRD